MSIYHEAPSEVITTARQKPDITHLVCSCQVDATPRLALCGADCSDVPARSDDAKEWCVVCDSLAPMALLRGFCERCH